MNSPYGYPIAVLYYLRKKGALKGLNVKILCISSIIYVFKRQKQKNVRIFEVLFFHSITHNNLTPN